MPLLFIIPDAISSITTNLYLNFFPSTTTICFHSFIFSFLLLLVSFILQLFSQMVMGFNGKNNLDIDRLTTMLEENRALLNDMATKECTDGATLPKLLFELVEQATTTTTENSNEKTSSTTPLDISRSPTPTQEGAIKLCDKLSGVEQIEENASCSSSNQEEEEENDNENMASLTSNVKQLQQNEMPTTQEAAASSTEGNTTPNTATSTSISLNTHQKSLDVVDAVAQSNNEGKVIVATQNKIKKHHRKSLGNTKKSSSGSASAAAAQLQQLQAAEVLGKVTSAQEIVGNLPKVWRVLMELLSHHKIDPVQFEEGGKGEDCYKSVETPNGPKAELSVSKTYLKLKVSSEE